MPRKATLSVMGIYNYYDNLFDGFRIPDNMEIDGQDIRQDIIDNICIESAGLEVLYSDPDVFKFSIEKWTNINFKIWEELQATRLYEYNPIWNKDGTVTETETRNLAGSRQEIRTGTNSEETDAETDVQAGGTNTESVKVFNQDNAAEWSDANKNVMDSSNNEIGHSERGGTFSEGTQGTTTDTGTIRHERSEKGNIGVTTTQAMIREQRDVVTFSTERYIIDSFIERFCLLVY